MKGGVKERGGGRGGEAFGAAGAPLTWRGHMRRIGVIHNKRGGKERRAHCTFNITHRTVHRVLGAYICGVCRIPGQTHLDGCLVAL